MSSVSKRPIYPLKNKIDKNGIIDFYWPYTRTEILNFEETLSQKCCEIIIHYNLNDCNKAVVKILQKYFIGEVVGLFQAELLKKRSAADKIEFTFDDYDKVAYPVWYHVLNQTGQLESKYLKMVKSGPNIVPLYKKLLKLSNFKKALSLLQFKKGKVTIEGVTLKPTTTKDLDECIISTQRMPTIKAHAYQINEEVIYSRSEKYFRAVSDDDFQNKKVPTIIDLFIELAKSLANQHNCKFSKETLAYLKNNISKIYLSLLIHYERLMVNQSLPKTLWIGSGGYVWDALLACAVREKEGYVCGHDHGSGLGHVRMGFAGFINLWLCDEYFTFAQGQAEGLQNSVPQWAYMGSTPPKITYKVHSEVPKKEVEAPPTVSSTKGHKKIYILSTIYDRDRGRHGPLMPDITQIDWQIRLISHLKEWGHDVVLKVHPETPFLPPKELDELGVQVKTERFENVMNDADLFIFDNIYTSVFRSAVESNIPIIIIDFEKIPWGESAQKMISERSFLLSGSFDYNNKANIMWNDLEDILNHSLSAKVSRKFSSYYYKA